MTVVQQEQSQSLLSDQEKSQLSDEVLELHFQQYVSERRRRIVSRLVQHVKPHQLYRHLKRFGYALTPTLVRSLVWHEQSTPPKKFPTSYLNGLRGLTAIKVFTFHYTFVYSDFGFQPWGVDDRHKHVLELPIIRYFYSGFTSHVFFGIAGYLTSLRLFQLLEKNDANTRSKILQNISGSLFRRAFRLYLPVFLITLITTTYIHLGFYEHNRPFILDRKLFPGEWYEPKPNMAETWSAQLAHWCHEMFDLTNIVTEQTVYPYHDQHLWSILSEMRASLHLYAVLVAVAQCKKHIRIVFMLFIAFMYFLWNHWEIWVYILGAVVAQADLLLTERDQEERETLVMERQVNGSIDHEKPLPQPQLSKPLHEFPHIHISKYNSQIRSAIRWLAFLIAFYFLSYPIDGSRDYAPGYIWLNRMIPEWMVRKDKFYPNIGTALLILLLARSNPDISKWRRALTSHYPQYLGKISFALYLVHGPLMHSFGYLIPHKISWMAGTELMKMGDFSWAFSIMIGWAITLVCALWAADVWTREVENRCVKFVKELERICFVKW